MILSEQLRLQAENKRLTEKVKELEGLLNPKSDDSTKAQKKSGFFGRLPKAFRKDNDGK